MSLKKVTTVDEKGYGLGPEFQVSEERQYRDDTIDRIRFCRHTNPQGSPWGGIYIVLARIFPTTTRELTFSLDNDERRALIEWLQSAEPRS